MTEQQGLPRPGTPEQSSLEWLLICAVLSMGWEVDLVNIHTPSLPSVIFSNRCRSVDGIVRSPETLLS